MWRIITCITIGCFAYICCANGNSVEKGGPKPSGGPCGKDVTTPTGGFHLNINNFTGECVWKIAPELANHTVPTISLFIHFLYLHDKDTITLFKNETDVANDSLSLIEPLRAQNGSVTIVTQESELFIKLTGDPKAPYQRIFEGMFQGHVCAFPIPPTLQIIHSPTYVNNLTGSIECTYTYNKDPHFRSTPSFLFEKFDMGTSDVSLSQSTKDGPYKENPRMDFFPLNDQPMVIDVKMTAPTKDSFCLRMHMVDSACHGYKKFDGHELEFTVDSPKDQLNNGTIVPECRWVFEHSDVSKILGVVFKVLHLDNTIDIIAINDGASELSTPLVQVTASSGNITKNQLIRSTGPYLWLAFKPITYASILSATVTVHAQGGHFNGSGNITMKPDPNDVVFLLEVEEGQIVLLKFHDGESDFPLPATLSVYDGFDKTNLLATLHGNVWYPVLSRSSKMMLIATQFSKGNFKAEFKGMSASCLHMGTFSNDNYILSGNCNSTCLWVVPPQDQSNTSLLLNLQYLALGKNDTIKIRELDSDKTILGEVSSSLSHVPQLMVPSNIGALVEIARAPCAKENTDIVMVGHSSYLPACGKDLSPSPQTVFQISSPLHPDTYPIYAHCQWKITAAKDNLLHLAFDSLKLAPSHCVKVIHSADNKTEQYVGSDLPADLFLTGEAFVEFDSGNCTKTKEALSLVSSEGFVLNGTVSDCGSVLSGKPSGTFTVPANKSLCIWKVSIPETGHDASDVVNVISYTVSKNDDKGNYELHVYDGDSVRYSRIVNDTTSDIWSRTSNLIFVYKRIDAVKPSTIVTIKYESISCNSTMQCDNKVCMHPDWRCNGINDCGDYTDERNCNAVPIPPITKLIGYSSTAFWVTITIMLALGAALGFGVPVCYQKYRNGQYRRFGEISIIE